MRNYRRAHKYSLPPEIHLMNKNEAKQLRKIKAETGLTEKEIRAHKNYRILLSKAQKKQGTKTHFNRRVLSGLKSILQELKLPKEHPLVLERIKLELERARLYDEGPFWGISRYSFQYYQMTPEQVIKLKK